MKKEYSRSFDEISRIVGDTDDFFVRNGVDSSMRMSVGLCIEELFVNMVNYNTETDSNILLEMSCEDGGVQVTLTDFDVERFDPTVMRDVDTDSPAAERDPGGLGLYLVLKMVNSIHYEYRNRTSRITFHIRALESNV